MMEKLRLPEKKEPTKVIKEIVNTRVSTRPDFKFEFENGQKVKKDDLTILDLFALPKEIIESKEKFLEWFERRFFSLRSKEDFDYFSQGVRRALEILQSHPYLLSPKIKEDFPISRSVVNLIMDKNNFHNLDQIMALFSMVSAENNSKNIKKFFTPDRKTKTGANQLSVCRILSVAYALEIIRKSQNLKKFFEYARFVLGQTESNQAESGLLSTLVVRGDKIKALEEPGEDFQFLDWMERGQVFQGCNLNNVGDGRSFYIPEVYIGTKSGLRAFLKILRDPTAELEMLTDFFRMCFVFSDKTSNQEIVELLNQLEKEADKKEKVITKINFQEKNYFSEEERKKYFSEEGGNKPLVRNMKVDKNPNSGDGFKNISAKIRLFNPNGKKPFFAFEIQFLRKSELENNERTGIPSHHFVFMINQQAELLSRFNSKMEKEEIIRKIREYLETIDTEKMPDKISGKDQKTNKFFQMDFNGSLKEKAIILFEFLEKTGIFKKVAPDFPSEKKPSLDKKDRSNFYIYHRTLEKILKEIGYIEK